MHASLDRGRARRALARGAQRRLLGGCRSSCRSRCGARSATCRSSGTRWCGSSIRATARGSRAGKLVDRRRLRPRERRGRAARDGRPAAGTRGEPGLSPGAARGGARARHRLHDAAPPRPTSRGCTRACGTASRSSSGASSSRRSSASRSASCAARFPRWRGSPSRSSSSFATCRRPRSARSPSPCSASTTRPRSRSSSSAPSSSRCSSSPTRPGASIPRCSRPRRRSARRAAAPHPGRRARRHHRALHRHARPARLGLDVPHRRRAHRRQLRHHLLHQPAGQVPQLRQRVRVDHPHRPHRPRAPISCWRRSAGSCSRGKTARQRLVLDGARASRPSARPRRARRRGPVAAAEGGGRAAHDRATLSYRDQAPAVAARFARLKQRPVILEVRDLVQELRHRRDGRRPRARPRLASRRTGASSCA